MSPLKQGRWAVPGETGSPELLIACGSENHDEVKSVLMDVSRNWGTPLAVVHDLRKALITAAGEAFEGVPQFLCHYHLAADIGKDILGPHADRLRRLFRHSKVRPKLRAFVRSLKGSAISETTGDLAVTSILDVRSRKILREYCTPDMVQGAVHACPCPGVLDTCLLS